MKKGRFIYTLVRSTRVIDNDREILYNSVVLDSFKSYESADNKKGEYEQLFFEKGLDVAFKFEIMTSMYYDE